MAYFKINNIDFSMYVNKLQVGTENFYKSMTNAAGNTLVKYVNSKRTLEVGIIPLDSTAMKNLLTEVDKFNVSISYRDPKTNALVENIDCIIPSHLIDYYTIQAGNVSYKAFSLQIKEL